MPAGREERFSGARVPFRRAQGRLSALLRARLFDCGMPSLREDIPSLRMTTLMDKVAICPYGSGQECPIYTKPAAPEGAFLSRSGGTAEAVP